MGEKSTAMIVNVDVKESKKLNEKEAKKEARMLKEEARIMKEARKKSKEEEEAKEAAERVAEFLEDPPDNADSKLGKENNEWEGAKQANTRNMTSIRNVAMASIRFGLSANATAAVANTALLDYGVIDKDNTTKIVDKDSGCQKDAEI